MNLTIAGLGTALPRHRISQTDNAVLATSLCCRNEEESRLVDVLYRRSGVTTRHSVLLNTSEGDLSERQTFFDTEEVERSLGPTTGERLGRYAQEAPVLAVAAGQNALDQAGISGAEITHVVTVSCTGFVAPGIELALIRELGLPPTVARTHVGFMGCHGALNGLRVAHAFIGANPNARVLLCAVELCTLHFYCGFDREKAVANSLFADGAAAIVAVPRQEHESEYAWNLVTSGSMIMPDSAQDMTWTIGDFGFEMTLSARVPELIGKHVRAWLEGWLSQQGLTVADIGCWAVHPGGPKILDIFESTMELPKTALAVSREVLAECGNMSSPTTLFIMERLRQRKARLPCVALGFGPGLAVEAALFR